MQRSAVLGAMVFGIHLCSLSTASAQADPGRMRLMGLAQFGFGGEVEVNGGDADLEASMGPMARFEAPLAKYFVLGAQFGALFWQSEFNDAIGLDRQVMIDFDVVPKVPFVRFAHRRSFTELYAALPVGFSLSVLRDQPATIDDVGPGWNIGLLMGVQHYFHNRLGLVGEMGWMRHAGSHDTAGGGNIDLHFNQFQLQLGLSYLL